MPTTSRYFERFYDVSATEEANVFACRYKNKLRTKYYDQFDVFQDRIDSIINDTDKNDKSIIDRLIGEKVQLFDVPIANYQHSNVNINLALKAA